MQNIDQQELNKFADLAAHWWDPAGDLQTLHAINPYRLEYITQKIPLAGKAVIDIGCGGGILAESMAHAGAEVSGIDMNPGLIDVAKLHTLESKARIDYRLTTAEAMAEAYPEQFDLVTCMEMLEHVPDPSSVVKACSQLLKPGGHVIFSTINRHPKAYIQAILAAEYLLRLLPKNTHDYAKFIRPAELATWARKAQLQTHEIRGIAYNPFSKNFKFTTDIKVNYFLYATKN